MVGFTQDDTGVDIEVSGGRSLRAGYLVGCDGGRNLVRKAAGIDFVGLDPSTSWMIAEVAWAGDLTDLELPQALSTWFGAAAPA